MNEHEHDREETVYATVELDAIQFLEYLLGDNVEKYRDKLDQYREDCKRKTRGTITIDIVLGEHEYYLTNKLD